MTYFVKCSPPPENVVVFDAVTMQGAFFLKNNFVYTRELVKKLSSGVYESHFWVEGTSISTVNTRSVKLVARSFDI